MANLATVEELADYMGVESIANTDQADLLLAIASGVVRDEVGQYFEQVVDDEFELRGTWQRELWLPQRPVTAVSELAVDGSLIEASAYKATQEGRVTWYPGLGGGLALDAPEWVRRGHWGGPDVLVSGKYTHGYPQIPDNVKGVVLEHAVRAIKHPDAGTVQSKTTGPYTITYSTAAAQGGLNSVQQRRLRKYKRKNDTLPAATA